MSEVRAHTIVFHHDGIAHVQHFGSGHVVEGSETIIDVPVGTTVVIRHIKAAEVGDCIREDGLSDVRS